MDAKLTDELAGRDGVIRYWYALTYSDVLCPSPAWTMGKAYRAKPSARDDTVLLGGEQGEWFEVKKRDILK